VRCAMEANHSAWRHYSDPSYGDSVRSVVGKRDMMTLAVLSLVHKRDVYRKGSSVGWWKDR